VSLGKGYNKDMKIIMNDIKAPEKREDPDRPKTPNRREDPDRPNKPSRIPPSKPEKKDPKPRKLPPSKPGREPMIDPKYRP